MKAATEFVRAPSSPVAVGGREGDRVNGAFVAESTEFMATSLKDGSGFAGTSASTFIGPPPKSITKRKSSLGSPMEASLFHDRGGSAPTAKYRRPFDRGAGSGPRYTPPARRIRCSSRCNQRRPGDSVCARLRISQQKSVLPPTGLSPRWIASPGGMLGRGESSQTWASGRCWSQRAAFRRAVGNRTATL